MLVLSRKLDEDIRIGDQIIVRVLAVKDGQVKLGIEAPRSVQVLRGELVDQAQKENQAAARVDRSSAAAVAASLADLRTRGKGTTE